MIRYFAKGEERVAYPCDETRILKTIQLNGVWVSNPLISDFVATGWEEYLPPVPPPYVPTYEEKVVSLIREQYDANDEAKYSRWNIEVNILHTKVLTEEEIAELTTYSEYVAWCHEKAKEE